MDNRIILPRSQSNETIEIVHDMMQLNGEKVLAVCSSLEQSLGLSDKSIITPIDILPEQVDFAKRVLNELNQYENKLNSEQLKDVYRKIANNPDYKCAFGLPKIENLDFIADLYNTENINTPQLGDMFNEMSKYDSFYFSNALDKCLSKTDSVLNSLGGRKTLIVTESKKLKEYLLTNKDLKNVMTDKCFTYMLF